MNNSNNSTSVGGLGVSGLLGVAFVVLKLTKVINWPWIWVLCPFWAEFAITLLIIGVSFLIVGIDNSRKRRNKKLEEVTYEEK